MEGQPLDIQPMATQPRTIRRDEQPSYSDLESFQQSSIPADIRSAALQEHSRTRTQGSLGGSSDQIDQRRANENQGSYGGYIRGCADVNGTPSEPATRSWESRSRGNSASRRVEDRSQEDEAVDDMRANRPIQIDRPSQSRRTSSLSSQMPPNSMLRYQRDGPYPGGDSAPFFGPSSSPVRRHRSSEAPEQTEVVAHRWQPDAEATFCPICRTQFSFFTRKHHCRKCGRVVCNSCSPHRITIPYQYIVQPPSERASADQLNDFLRPGIDGARSGSSHEVTSLGGGERVRLCNPCVPDPNVAPPQRSLNGPPRLLPSPNRQGRSASAASSFAQFQRQQGPLNQADDLQTLQEALRNDPRRTSIFNSSSVPHTSQRGHIYSNRGQEGWEARSRSSTVSGALRDSAHVGGVQSTMNRESIYTAHQSYARLNSDSGSEHVMSGPSPSRPKDQPLSGRPAVPRIADEDECWICHRELPSRSLPNFEELRTKHVSACVEYAAAGSTSRAAAQNSPGPAGSGSSAASPANALSDSQSASYRRVGLFKYKATEKDCVDDAECTVCLEEFEEGVEMGRLECFCRFHYKCIQDWWKLKHGQCPVHQPSEY